MKRISELLGIYIETDYYVPILLDHIKDPDYTISPRLISNITNVFAHLLQNENEETMELHLKDIVNLICKLETDYSDNPLLLTSTFRLIFSLVHSTRGLMNKVISQVFSALLTV